jgi:hypothetical protein
MNIYSRISAARGGRAANMTNSQNDSLIAVGASVDHPWQDAPPTLLDSVQASYSITLPPELPFQFEGVIPLSGVGSTYFPKSRLYFRPGKVFIGQREGSLTKLKINGLQCLRVGHDLPRQSDEINLLSEEELNFVVQKAKEEKITPFELAVDAVRWGLVILASEVRQLVARRLGDPMASFESQFKIYRAEFPRDYGPVTTQTAEELTKTFERAVGQESGLIHTEIVWKGGRCPRFRVVPRLDGKARIGRNERTTIKGYKKREMFRTEITYEYPTAESLLLTPEDLCGQLEALSKDANARLDRLHQGLGDISRASHIREDVLLSILKGTYGLIGCKQNARWQNFCTQVAELGVYDPATAPKDLRVRRETLRDKVAHPTWGILEKRGREAGSGAGNVPYYSLRTDWREALERWPD